MLIKVVNALRPSAAEAEGTGTYADGMFSLSLVRKDPDISSSLRASYAQDHLAALSRNEPIRANV